MQNPLFSFAFERLRVCKKKLEFCIVSTHICKSLTETYSIIIENSKGSKLTFMEEICLSRGNQCTYCSAIFVLELAICFLSSHGILKDTLQYKNTKIAVELSRTAKKNWKCCGNDRYNLIKASMLITFSVNAKFLKSLVLFGIVDSDVKSF